MNNNFGKKLKKVKFSLLLNRWLFFCHTPYAFLPRLHYYLIYHPQKLRYLYLSFLILFCFYYSSLTTHSNIKLNNIGDSAFPCLRPVYTMSGPDTSNVIFILISIFFRLSSIRLISLLGKLNSFNTFLNFHDFSMICLKLKIWSNVDLLVLKPPW